MISELIPILKQSVMITGFVFVMMLVIEYINVQTNGIWQKKLTGNRWKQYIFAALLGAIPGCLGAFTVVALFSHRLVSFGAIVAAMIATSGDEAFVMLAMFPKTAILLTIIILIVGIIAGYITDKFYVPKKLLENLSENQLPLHSEEHCKCFEKDKFYTYLMKPSIYRIILILIIALLLVAVITGVIAGDEKMWIKISVTFVISVSLFILATVPEHFLKKHLWEHIAKVHAPRIFLWILGTLLVFHFLMSYINIEAWITDNMLYLLIIAVFVGIIPESGPHFIFITLFAQGAIPFSILLASSISQDGHGMLPLLAESKRGFLGVKLVNVIYALIVGLIAYAIGY
ncbi:MAG: putative manganese transporter [Candidatus Margulisbacteria bacterium]|nr:putative manganese transporter [Candidatus Margulisiibacteriota bacterium]